jgi:hypothetical protein
MTHAPFLPSTTHYYIPVQTTRLRISRCIASLTPCSAPAKSFPDIGELDSVPQSRQDTRQSLSRGEFKDVREAAFFNRTWMTDRYCNVREGVDFLEGYLRDIWYMFYQPSLYTSRETLDHDRLRGG